MLSAASSRRLRHQLQLAPHNLHDLGMGFCRGAASIDHGDTLRLAGRNRQVSLAHAPEESAVLPLETVFIAFPAAIVSRSGSIAAASPFHAGGDLGVHKNGQVGLQVATKYAVQRQHRFFNETPPTALVSFGGVGEAIAK